MLVYIAWSGERGRLLAEAYSNWMPSVLQAVQTFFSPADVEKGTRWNPEITRALEEAKAGIVLLTPESLNAPWVLFEAGALSAKVGKARVYTILFGLEPKDVSYPLAQFQLAKFSWTETKGVLASINGALGDRAVKESVLDAALDKWWPDLETKVKPVLESPPPELPQARDSEDILEEILSHVRQLASESPLQRRSLSFDTLTTRPGDFVTFAGRKFEVRPLETEPLWGSDVSPEAGWEPGRRDASAKAADADNETPAASSS